MQAPTLLRGARAIGAHLRTTAGHAQHLHNHRRIPTWTDGGSPMATAAGLDDWQRLYTEGRV